MTHLLKHNVLCTTRDEHLALERVCRNLPRRPFALDAVLRIANG